MIQDYYKKKGENGNETRTKIKIILLILIIILISLMSFGGLFIQKNGRMANLLPEYIKGMDLKEIGI